MRVNCRKLFSLKSMMLVSGALGVLQIGSLELVRAEQLRQTAASILQRLTLVTDGRRHTRGCREASSLSA
jgi:hypothetical protein